MTTLDIWNMALGWIGTGTVASARENRPEVVQCRLFWDSARRQCLRDYPWGFAQARAVLAQKEVPEAWQEDWQFAYAVPDGCLKAHRVTEPGASSTERPYELVRDAEGKNLILTDVSNALLDYTVDETDASRFDDSFGHLVARKLACLIAIPLLKNNTQKIQELESLYRSALPVSHDNDSAERRDREIRDSWIAAREGWS